jgi:uncharacterized protein (DUF305 family)
MKPALLVATTSLILALSPPALAQTQDHQQHHPGGAPSQAAPAAPQPPAQVPAAQAPAAQPPAMAEQCRAMMQNMPQGCMQMMQNMGGMMGQGGMMGHGGMGRGMGQGAPSAQSSAIAPATRAYLESADRMHGPMLEGLKAADPDVAFVRGMIAHHQGAIDMAKVRLQYGKDEQTRKWADDVIREQQREIAEMQDWLKKNAP